ncbi:hypothetical protein [Nocardioides marmoraquaticus]
MGALLTLLGTLLVQLAVVPAVDYRRRRAERWLTSLTDLGEWLVREHDSVARNLAWRQNRVLKARETWDLDWRDMRKLQKALDRWDHTAKPHKWQARFELAHRNLDDASDDMTRSMKELFWLMSRIEANSTRPSRTRLLRALHRNMCQTAAAWQMQAVEGFYDVTTLSEASFDGIAIELGVLEEAHTTAQARLAAEVRRMLANYSKARALATDPFEEAVAAR